MMRLSLGAKAFISVIFAGIGLVIAGHFGWLPASIVQRAAVPNAVELPTEAPEAPETSTTVASSISLPSEKPTSTVKTPPMRLNGWAWNAQFALHLANGGPMTTAGSLMEKYGVRLVINRQDDTNKSQAEQIKLAESMSKGESNPSDGIHFVTIMGDGAAQYLTAINKLLSKYGPDYLAEIVGALGYSRGEDAFMGPQEWRDNPESMKGGVVAGVLRDGDWNIAVYDAAQNNIKNNPDETTWDPDALNWVATDDYVKAGEMYISGYCEDRPIVRDGRKTNEKKHICVQGVVTWTPGDVSVAKRKGGIIKVLSTKENSFQMPCVVIGIHKWDMEHAKQIQAMLGASYEAADQIRVSPEALSRAAKASFAIYKEESAAYWLKYYKGVIESDKTGLPIALGGSSVMNLGDNLVLFGLAEGAGGLDDSIYKQAYEGFGNIAKQQYPRLVPSFPPVREAVNTQFLNNLKIATKAESKPELPVFEESGPIAKENVVAKRNWSITFDTGKATFTSAAASTLEELYSALAVGSAMSVEIDGHTDNVGNTESNKSLSEERAFAVRSWLQQKNPTLFPDNRLSVRAFGDTAPIAPNATPEGRAQNRRVTVVLGVK